MADILEAVKYCHANYVVHNDLKPDNLMYADDTENSPLKLIDFGLAKRFIPGQSFGGPSGDIWAVGVIMYSLLCGYQPDIDYGSNGQKSNYTCVTKVNHKNNSLT